MLWAPYPQTLLPNTHYCANCSFLCHNYICSLEYVYISSLTFQILPTLEILLTVHSAYPQNF